MKANYFSTPSQAEPIAHKPVDERSDLLKQIREGKQLKKVFCDARGSRWLIENLSAHTVYYQVQIDDEKSVKKNQNDMTNVADILAFAIDQRYGHLQGSDSESTEEDYSSDNDFSD